ncbi:unnamed protein product [Rotaria sordida]|uniref:Uncharacterized protein n=1 Tax=Rotaria sordida TaxID=392033 RepID=A0A814RB83_9BILA|nr:unnamed protein product [Rotaria sordida]CAF1131145.1 unnamed protein product [Rotaria sordida]
MRARLTGIFHKIETLPSTLDIENNIHIIADTDKLLADIPCPFAFDALSNLDFELLNKINYKFQYDLHRRQHSASLTYNSQVNKVVDNHLFSEKKKTTSKRNFFICTKSHSLTTHWDIDTILVQDKNDIEVDLFVRFDRQPNTDSPKSFIGFYNVILKASKHELFQLIDLNGNVTKQSGILSTYNSITYRIDNALKEINRNLIIDHNITENQSPLVRIDNELEYLRGNGDHLHEILQLSGNPLSTIRELTIDRENHIGKMKWLQQFGVHVEFGNPLSNLTVLYFFYNLSLLHKDDDQTIDASLGFKLASSKIAPTSFYFSSGGLLNTTLHVSKTLRVRDDIALSTSLTAQYNPQSISQVNVFTNSNYYGQEFQNSLYALFKQHQVTVRSIFNTSGNEYYKYEMDIGFNDNLLTGHTERKNGKQTIISDINAKICSPTGTAKLDVKVLDQLEIKFDHTHLGRLRDDDFRSKTLIDGNLLRSDNKRSSSYSGSVVKDDGNINTDKICLLYGKSRLDNHSHDRITPLTLLENISTTNELIEDLHNKGFAMRHATNEHMMVYIYINNDDNDKQTNQIKQDKLKMELGFIEKLLRKTKHQLYKRLKHLQRHRIIKITTDDIHPPMAVAPIVPPSKFHSSMIVSRVMIQFDDSLSVLNNAQ